MRNYLLITALIFFASCSHSKNITGNSNDQQLEKLVEIMTGRYSSEAQSETDTSYFNISLVMVPIWTNRTDGKWLYVEQAVANNMAKPYRQRVYHLQHLKGNIFTSDIFTIKNALKYAGVADNAAMQDSLNFDKIELKDGCTVTLMKTENVYIGGTESNKCPSGLRGAKYASTKITLTPGKLISWDQGFDADGKQVWGATKGGYIFIKKYK